VGRGSRTLPLTRLCGIDLDELGLRARFRYGHSVGSECFYMEVYGLPDELNYFITRFSYCNATREVRDVGSPARFAAFHHHHVSHRRVPQRFSPAWRKIALKVPGGTSTLAFPATVTVPCFERCLNCRWLPRVRV